MLLKLALKAGEPQRLTLGWGSYWEPFVIGFDGQVVHQVERQQQLWTGVTVPLPDGRVLHVRLMPGPLSRLLEVQCDGVTVPDSPYHPKRWLERAVMFLYFLSALSLFGGDKGLTYERLIYGAAYILLGVGLSRHSRLAATFAMALPVIDLVAAFLKGLHAGFDVDRAVLTILVEGAMLYCLVGAAQAVAVLEERKKQGPSTPQHP